MPLKKLCSDLLGIDIEALNLLKNENATISYVIDEHQCEILSEATNIPLEQVREKCIDKKITTVREMLQFIGTDLIRSCNPSWHIDLVKQLINKRKKYVIDDVRFPNEKQMIEDLGGDCWFVIRNRFDNISHHESEESIKHTDCGNKIIINDGSLKEILYFWGNFVKNYKRNVGDREAYLQGIHEDDSKSLIVDSQIKKDELTSYDHNLMIRKELTSYDPNDSNIEGNIACCMWIGSGMTLVRLEDESTVVLNNIINAEDIKEKIHIE